MPMMGSNQMLSSKIRKRLPPSVFTLLPQGAFRTNQLKQRGHIFKGKDEYLGGCRRGKILIVPFKCVPSCGVKVRG